MQVTIHGPNLLDQSKGTFHIHTAACRDNDKEIARNGSEHPWTIEADDKHQVVEEVYGDQINEGASYDSCRQDIWFAPCVELDEEASTTPGPCEPGTVDGITARAHKATTNLDRERIVLEAIALGAQMAADAARFATKTGGQPVEEAARTARIRAQEWAEH